MALKPVPLSGCLWDMLADHTKEVWIGGVLLVDCGGGPSLPRASLLSWATVAGLSTEVLREDTCSSTANRSLPSPLFPTPDCIAGDIWGFLGPL